MMTQHALAATQAKPISERDGKTSDPSGWHNTLLEHTPDLIARLTLTGELTWANAAFAAALNCPLAALQTTPLAEWILLSETLTCWQTVLLQIAANGSTQRRDFLLMTEQGEQWFDGCFVPEWNDSGEAVGVFLTARDITERKQIEQQTREHEHLIQRITDSSSHIIYLYDLVQQKCTYANRELTTILGYTFDEFQAMGMNMISLLTHPDDLEPVMAHHDRMLNAHDDVHSEIEYRMRHKQGGWKWLLSRDVIFSRTPEGLPRQILGSAQDITERKRIEEQIESQMLALNEYSLQLEMHQVQLEQANVMLEALATTDGLTGLKNIRAFQERLSEEFQRAQRYREPLSLILIDVDHFKEYNDSFGHPAGDEVLKRVAQILTATARETDYVARYGGEEFIVFLPHTAAEGAMGAAERLRHQIEAAEWRHRPITVSIGIACVTPRVLSPATLIEDADKALYQSKSNGRNCSTLHHVEHRWTDAGVRR